MSRERSYYSILQVNPAASQEAIEAAYRRLSKVYDPEASKKPKAAARMTELNEAYAVLSDKKKRADYDRQRSQRRRGGGRARSRSASAKQPGGGEAQAPSPLPAPYLLSGVAIAISVVALVLAVIAVSEAGDEGSAVSSQPTASPTLATSAATAPVQSPGGTATAPQSPGATAPANPPEVSGQTVTTASGLQFIDIQAGSGASPAAGQTAVVNYTGWLQSDGSKFDSSLDSGKPFEFLLGAGQVIKGWDEGVATMKLGGKRRLIIPPDLAYGAEGRPGIPPNSTLIFDIELLQVR